MVANNAHLGHVVSRWRRDHGLTQVDVQAAGGPSDSLQSKIESGSWSSRSPGETLAKIDRGFGWPPGTARRVLLEGHDPAVGGGGHDPANGYVSAPGPRVEGGLSDDEVLQRLDEMERDIATMRERLAQRREQGS